MRISSLFALAAFAVILSPLACTGASEEEITAPNEEASEEDELRSFTIDETDNGKTFTVTEGQNVVVKLPSNPSTGFKWQVASTDRTFGYPYYTRFLPNGDAVGSGGLERMTWRTKTAMSMVGSHTVKLEYKRSWESGPAEKTFSFTIEIVSGDCPLNAPNPSFCPSGRIKANKDENGCTTSYECVTDCRANGCGGEKSGKWCSFCWGSFACIPNGALC
jgi:inhibitor of cysteine peptidase